MKNVIPKYAMGGIADESTDVEVEDNEFAKTPEGTQVQFDGNTHENGGIDVNLPIGTKIFSDRIKFQGKTLAARAKARAAREKKIVENLEGNETDAIGKNTLNRILTTNTIEENNDLLIQELHDKQDTDKKFGYGGVVRKYGNGTNYLFDPNNPSLKAQQFDNTISNPLVPQTIQPLTSDEEDYSDLYPDTNSGGLEGALTYNYNAPQTANKSVPMTTPVDDTGSNNTLGNVMGGIGLAVNSIAPLITTLANRKNTPTNKSSFMGYGKNAMDSNFAAENALNFAEDENDIDNAISRNTATQDIVNNTSNLATQNALRTGVDYNSSRANTQADAQFANQKAAILDKRAQTSLNIDATKMAADERTDIANRQDTDNFYTNVNKDLGNLGTSVQTFGKNMNQEQYNQDYMTLLGDLSKYGISYKRNKKGQLVQVIK